MMKASLILSVATLVTSLAAIPIVADTMDCPSMEPTIESLHRCVQHAFETGAIDSQGVAESLLAKVGAAHAAADRGDFRTATNILRAFIQEVQAQSGLHIEAAHADHMIMHAGMVIEALSS
jgi:hypothetical protein